MRCKKHPSDLSSSVGVCATCLRERLIVLIAAQAQVQAQTQAQLAQRTTTTEDRHPPPLVFPRSVSPYVTRRKSDDTNTATWPHHTQFDHRFYSTPQVGPTYNTTTSTSHKKKTSKFSIFSKLFRSRSEKSIPDPRVSSRDSCHPTSSSSSPWFTTIFPPRRKKQSRLFSLEDPAAAAGRRSCRRLDRGMSPERGAEFDADCDRSPSESGCSSESAKRTPAIAPPSVRRTRTGHVSGLAFCLSPLVRASPNRHWNQKGGLPPDMAFSGEIRGSVKPHLSTAASFCANRSRKLADFGRVNHNR